MKTTSYKLKTPLVWNDNTWSTLGLRVPNVEDMIATDAVQGHHMKLVASLSNMTGVPVPALGKLASDEFWLIIAAIPEWEGPDLGNSSVPASTGPNSPAS